MFTSHTINSCKKMLRDYGDFNNFIDHMLVSMGEEIDEESDKVEQKDKEAYEHIKTIRSELESLHKELKISIAANQLILLSFCAMLGGGLNNNCGVSDFESCYHFN